MSVVELPAVLSPDMFTGSVPQPPAATIRPVVAQRAIGQVTERVTVRSMPVLPQVSHLAQGAEDSTQWTWRELRDYVVSEIVKITGVFPRDEAKEAAVFRSFVSRYPDNAAAIAKFVFQSCDGYWKGAPVSVNRFCKNSDKYFADIILARLV